MIPEDGWYTVCLSLQDPVQGGNKPLVFLGFTYSHPDIGWISENIAGADDDAFLKQRLEHLPQSRLISTNIKLASVGTYSSPRRRTHDTEIRP